MKKVLSVLLVALMLASVLAVGASAVVRDDGLNHDYGEIANVERRSIRLDAIKDSAYDEAEEIEINTVSANSSAPAEGRTLADAVAYVVYALVKKYTEELVYDCDDLLDECDECDAIIEDAEEAVEEIEEAATEEVVEEAPVEPVAIELDEEATAADFE